MYERPVPEAGSILQLLPAPCLREGLDAPELFRQAVPLFIRLVIIIFRIVELRTEGFEKVRKLLQLAPQPFKILEDLLRASLDLQSLQPQCNHPQVCVKAVR